MPKRCPFHLIILGMLLSLVLSGGAVDAAALVRYSSNGFEQFLLGTVHNQDGWGVVGPWDGAVIQSSIAASGSRSLALSSGGGRAYAYRLDDWSPDSTGQPVVSLRATIRPEASGGWGWVFFYTDHDAGNGIVLEVGAFNPLTGGRVYAYEVPGGEGTPWDLGPFVPGQWGEIAITVDYHAQQYDVAWNGADTGFRDLVINAGASAFGGWSFGVQDDMTAMHVDDVVLTFRETTVLPDVPRDHWAWQEIYACFRAGIVGGYDGGLYHPDWPVSRDQMAVFIARAVTGGDENVPDGPPDATFNDVPTDHWAYKYIEYCVANDIVQGFDPVTYDPSGNVSRAAMAAFIARALAGGDGNVPDGPPDATFDDVPTDHWAYKYVEYCVANDIVQGYDPVTYNPDITVSRDQMAVFIFRAFDLPVY